MVKRFVVRVEHASRLGASGAIDSWTASWTAASWLLGAVLPVGCFIPGATILSGIWSFSPPLVESSLAFSMLLITVLVSTGIMVCAGDRATTVLRECVVEIYPLGVLVQTQLRTATAGPRATEVEKSVFLARESIIDCIVCEVILGHKVISQVLFRVRRRSKDTDLIDPVPCFPGVENMTYLECLAMREEMQSCLATPQAVFVDH